MRPKVRTIAHYNDVFYDKSETFIYNFISSFKRFHPIYLAREFLNLDLFPIPKEDKFSIPTPSPDRYTAEWLYRGILRKYFGMNTTNEEMLLRKRGVKLIHAHFGPQGFYSLKMRGRLKIPLVTNFYGYDVSELAKIPEWIERYKTLFKKGDLFLVEGLYMKSRLMELGCPEVKIQIQRIAIPVKSILFEERKPKKKEEKIIFLFCGRFVEKKGLVYALQSIKSLREKHDNVEFRIIGDGDLKLRLEGFIEHNNMTSYVRLLGIMNYSDYLKEMQRADIFISPSVTAANGDNEGGAPTTLLEAQASGLPIVSTYHADIPNIVIPGRSALLANEKDSEGLTANMEYLLKNQQSWREMGRIGRKFVETFHDIEKEIIGLENKYTELLNAYQ